MERNNGEHAMYITTICYTDMCSLSSFHATFRDLNLIQLVPSQLRDSTRVVGANENSPQPLTYRTVLGIKSDCRDGRPGSALRAL